MIAQLCIKIVFAVMLIRKLAKKTKIIMDPWDPDAQISFLWCTGDEVIDNVKMWNI